MTIVPVITLTAAICLALAFEFAYALINSRISLSLEQWQWTAVYWMVICVAGLSSGVIPSRPAFPPDWIGFFLVAWVHVCMNAFAPSVFVFHRRRADADRSDSGQTVREQGRDISRQRERREPHDELPPDSDEQTDGK